MAHIANRISQKTNKQMIEIYCALAICDIMISQYRDFAIEWRSDNVICEQAIKQ